MSNLLQQFEKLETQLGIQRSGETRQIEAKTEREVAEFKKLLKRADAVLKNSEFRDDGLGID